MAEGHTSLAVTVPKSVKMMSDCSIGLEYKDEDSYDEVAVDGFVLYGAKNYANQNKLKFVEAK